MENLPSADSLMIENTVVIQAAPEKVWRVLTDPQETPKYMFGCRTVSTWEPGGSLEWKMEYEGKEITAVKGFVQRIEPGHYLSYTVFDPNSTIPDLPENYLTVTYALRKEQDDTVLTVTQGDYATVADGKRRYEESFNGGEGWNPILQKIKQVAEG